MSRAIPISDLAERIEAHCRAKRMHPLSLSRDAARAAGIAFNNAAWCEARRLAAEAIGLMDETETIPCPKVPEGQELEGLTTYEKLPNGGGRYVKTKAIKKKEASDEELLERLAERVNAIVKPRRWTVPRPKLKPEADDWMGVHVFGDPHFGMKASGKDTGRMDWDLARAVEAHDNAIDALIHKGTKARRGVLLYQGDNTHADNTKHQTFKGTQVEVDGSHFDAVCAFKAHAFKSADKLLGVYDELDLVFVRGNHDDNTAFYLQLIAEAYYRDDPRVNVPVIREPAHALQHGETMIVVTHGHKLKMKPDDIMLWMASRWPEIWGATKKRYVLSGHVHHSETLLSKHSPGGLRRTAPTLAAADGWHAHEGYWSHQSTCKLLFEKGTGLREEFTEPIETLLAVAS